MEEMSDEERVKLLEVARNITATVELNYLEAKSLAMAARSWRAMLQMTVTHAELLGVDPEVMTLIAEGDLLMGASKLEAAFNDSQT